MARKILLADDSVTAQNMGRKILADAGYEVLTVNNGSAALKRISEQRPDLIVLDVYMPGYSGLEVCQRLKEVNETARIPILLTVGKLEPFKPEEARRVRADAFIVKPFEASELLSALSKLEDKIVPRPESSKPGRFARATAAIEEGHRDNTVAAEEDSGWKSRISFPKKKKKEEPVEANADDPSIYNAVNKDLRTVVEHHTPGPTEAAPEAKVDLGALAPEGLPKDVTPEEIAALAAAAARMQGKTLESKATEPRAENSPAQTQGETGKGSEETVSTAPAEKAAAPEPAVATLVEQAAPTVTAPATPEEDKQAPVSSVEEIPVTAAVAVKEESPASDGSQSGNGPWPQVAASQAEPVTMAVAAGAGSSSIAARWTAVAIAPALEEMSLSLEAEMQKAYAAFAAEAASSSSVIAEEKPPATSAAPSEAVAAGPAPAEPVSSIPAEPSPAEQVASVAAEPLPAEAARVPELPSVMSEAPSGTNESASSAVKEFETVAAPYVPDNGPTPESFAPAAEAPVVAVSETSQPQVTETTPEPSSEVVSEPAAEQISKSESPIAEISAPVSEVRSSEVPEVEKPLTEAATVVAEAGSSSEPNFVSSESEEVGPSEPSGGTDDMAKKESDIAATTAAAWASWRKIREGGPHSGQPKSSSQEKMDSDEAAMAVAAGAEKRPEEASADSDPEISSIVDSVLADLRPKIVEEISRKLGKKK